MRIESKIIEFWRASQWFFYYFLFSSIDSKNIEKVVRSKANKACCFQHWKIDIPRSVWKGGCTKYRGLSELGVQERGKLGFSHRDSTSVHLVKAQPSVLSPRRSFNEDPFILPNRRHADVKHSDSPFGSAIVNYSAFLVIALYFSAKDRDKDI